MFLQEQVLLNLYIVAKQKSENKILCNFISDEQALSWQEEEN